MKEKGACFVNYYSLLAWPLAICLVLLSERLYKMNLCHVVLSLAIYLSNSKLTMAAIFMPHDFVGEEFRSGSAVQFCAMWC